MNDEFKLLMIGAMYENGGNTVQRYLDGHSELYVYPFESQLGTKYVNDIFSSTFPLKYRWPTFPRTSTVHEDYELIIDEECKVRIKTPHVSKFRDFDIILDDAKRKNEFVRILKRSNNTVSDIIEAFFRATFNTWENYNRTNHEKIYVGYSPALIIDLEKIFATIKNAHFVHVVRNPFSAYAETKKRPVPLGLQQYITLWTINQHFAIIYKRKYPKKLHIVHYEDLVRDPVATLFPVCEGVGVVNNDRALSYPTWNGIRLDEVFPWGTIKEPSEKANFDIAYSLNKEEIAEIQYRTEDYLRLLNIRIDANRVYENRI